MRKATARLALVAILMIAFPDWLVGQDAAVPNFQQQELIAQQIMAKAAEQMVFLTAWQVILGLCTLIGLAVTIYYTRKTAETAIESNRVTREAFVTDQRAWLTVRMIVNGNLVFQRGSASASVSLKISNIGKTPALDAHTNMKMVLDDYEEIPRVLKKFADENRELTQWGRLVLPGETYDRGWGPSLDQQQIETSRFGEQLLLPTVIGCVTYQILPDKTLRQTAFAYILGRTSGALAVDRGDVPGNELELTVTTGGFAD